MRSWSSSPRARNRTIPSARTANRRLHVTGGHRTWRPSQLGYHQAGWPSQEHLLRRLCDVGYFLPVHCWLCRARARIRRTGRCIHAAGKFRVYGIPNAVHADRGPSRTSKLMAALLSDLDVVRSHSRPKVSNDNPYSESAFKTLKYLPDFPERFGSLQHALDFMASNSRQSLLMRGGPFGSWSREHEIWTRTLLCSRPMMRSDCTSDQTSTC